MLDEQRLLLVIFQLQPREIRLQEFSGKACTIEAMLVENSVPIRCLTQKKKKKKGWKGGLGRVGQPIPSKTRPGLRATK